MDTYGRGYFRRRLAVLASVCACLASCEDPGLRGQLMLSVSSDMAVPSELDHLTIEVLQNGVRRYANEVRLSLPASLPATLAIVRGENSTDTVQVRVGGWLVNRLRVAREVVTTISPGRNAYLPVHLQWLCEGQVVPHNGMRSADAVQSSCPDGKTCIFGACVSPTVPVMNLPDFETPAMADAGPGGCFDVAACFAAASQVFVDQATCTIDLPQGGLGVNVGLVVADGPGAYCTGGKCYTPLDGMDPGGWMLASSRLQLPPAVCASPAVLGVAVTTLCTTKTRAVPACPKAAP